MTQLRFGMSTPVNITQPNQELRDALSTVRAHVHACDCVVLLFPLAGYHMPPFLEARECEDHILTFPCYRIKWHPCVALKTVRERKSSDEEGQAALAAGHLLGTGMGKLGFQHLAP